MVKKKKTEEEIRKEREEDLILWYRHSVEGINIVDLAKSTGLDRKTISARVDRARLNVMKQMEKPIALQFFNQAGLSPPPGLNGGPGSPPQQTTPPVTGKEKEPKIPGSITQGIVIQEGGGRQYFVAPQGMAGAVILPQGGNNPLMQCTDVTQLSQVGMNAGEIIGAALHATFSAFDERSGTVQQRTLMSSQGGAVLLPIGVTIIDILRNGFAQKPAPKRVEGQIIDDGNRNQ